MSGVEGVVTEVAEQFVVEFDYRSDNGPRLVGPFLTKEAAIAWTGTLLGPDWEAGFCVCPLVSPWVAVERGEQ